MDVEGKILSGRILVMSIAPTRHIGNTRRRELSSNVSIYQRADS